MLKNKRLSIVAICLALALIVSMIGFSFAHFSDTSIDTVVGTIGTVDIVIEDNINLLNSQGMDILNPGDIRDASFTIKNNGNKSTDYNVIVKLRTAVPMSNNLYDINYDSMLSEDIGEPNHYEVYSSEYELYNTKDLEYVKGYGYMAKKDVLPLQTRYINSIFTEIVYVLNGGLLSGNSDLDEQETEYYKVVQEAFDRAPYSFLDIAERSMELNYINLLEEYGIEGYENGVVLYPSGLTYKEGKILAFADEEVVSWPEEYEGHIMPVDYIYAYNIHWYDFTTIAVSENLKGFIVRDKIDGEYVYSVLNKEEYEAYSGLTVQTYKDFDDFFAEEVVEYISDIDYQKLTDEEKIGWNKALDSKTYDISLLFDAFSDNAYQASEVEIIVEVRAKQHRNAEAGWELVGNYSQVDKSDSIFEFGYDEQYRPIVYAIRDDVDKDSLTDVVIPEGVEVIGQSLFEGCTNLKTVTLPSTIKEIEHFAFYGCENLTTINFPEGLEIIDIAAFEYCTNLDNVILPDSLVSIAEGGFASCTSLETLDLGDGLKHLGKEAFYNCTSLTEVTIPASFVYNDRNVFSNSGLKKAILANGCTAVTDYLFEECLELETVVLPNGITYIGNWSFYNCQALSNINLPDSIKHIGKAAFGHTYAIGDVVLPDNLTSWAEEAFWCSGLTSITFNDKIDNISENCFYHCPNLKTIDIPENVKIIDYEAFRESGLTTFTVTDNFREISTQAFYGCEDLKEVYMESTKALKQYVFLRAGVEKVVFGEDCVRVPYAAFMSCTNLKEVVFNEGMREIEYGAFWGCTGLTEITFPETLEFIEEQAFRDCTGLTSIEFPASLKTMEDYAFSACNNLTEITFNNFPSMGNYIFTTGSAYTKVQTTIYVPRGISFSYSWARDYRNFNYVYF